MNDYPLGIPPKFKADPQRGALAWQWSPLPTPEHPDGIRRLSHGRAEPAHQLFEVQVSQFPDKATDTDPQPQTVTMALFIGHHVIENKEAGDSIYARVRAVHDGGKYPGEWSDWVESTALPAVEWTWDVFIGREGKDDIIPIKTKGENPTVKIAPDLVKLAVKRGVTIRPHCTRWMANRGQGQRLRVVPPRGAGYDSLYDGEWNAEILVRPRTPWYRFFLKERNAKTSVKAISGNEDRVLTLSLQGTDRFSVSRLVFAFGLLQLLLGVIVPSCINAMNTDIGRAIWQQSWIGRLARWLLMFP